MRWPLVLALTAVIAVSACGGSSTTPSGTGTLRMMLKDSPFTDGKSLLVTFSEVDAHRGEETNPTWNRIDFAGGALTRTCDLKRLQTAQDILGVGLLTSGHYTQVRLVVATAVIYFDGATNGDVCGPTIAPPPGRKANVTIPSREVKLNREFDVPLGGATTMLIDFDGDKSVQDTGNGQYMMSPVINIASVE